MIYIGNAFSAGMLAHDSEVTFQFVTLEHARKIAGGFRSRMPSYRDEVRSCVGHADTALLMSSLLGLDIPMRRESTELQSGDGLLIGQYNGPRLSEGATSLPEGARIRWIWAVVRPARHADHIDGSSSVLEEF